VGVSPPPAPLAQKSKRFIKMCSGRSSRDEDRTCRAEERRADS